MTDTSILNLVAEHVLLKPTRYPGRFLACCPFHQERTPSFTVDEKAGSFFCFGCGAEGDAAAFRRLMLERPAR